MEFLIKIKGLKQPIKLKLNMLKTKKTNLKLNKNISKKNKKFKLFKNFNCKKRGLNPLFKIN